MNTPPHTAPPAPQSRRPRTRAWPRWAGSIPQQWSRLRWWLFAGVALLYGLAFNGQWLVSPDSALYRSLGRSLADGRGYVYQGEAHDHAYPGLPYFLAAARRVFGQDVLPALVLNLALTAASLVLVYFMVRRVYPRWVAVAVVTLTGSSNQILHKTSQVLTDVPFFFAVCLSLFAHDRMCRHEGRDMFPWLALTMLGVALAAVMRPAFWIVVAALVVWLGWDAMRGSWKRAAWGGAGLLLTGVVWALLLDARDGGRDEAKLLRVLDEPRRMVLRIGENLPLLLREHLAEALFGTRLGPGIDLIVALLVIGGGVFVLRRHALWGLLIAATFAVTVCFAGTLPRYYLMIYPLLALSWIEALRHVTHRLPTWYRNQALGVGLGLALGCNLVMAGVFIARQHREPFLEHYEDGQWVACYDMAAALREHVPADARVLGPQTRMLTFESGRDVLDPGLLLDDVEPDRWSEALSKARVRYVILPRELHENRKHIDTLLASLEATLPPGTLDHHAWVLVRLKDIRDGDPLRFDAVIASGPRD